MPEAIVLCVDVSEWMRNGDYIPNRLEAQHDAINLVCTAKLQQHAENSLATVASGGNVDLLTSFSSDVGNILSALHGLKLKGNFLFSKGISVAQLALKHRTNKALTQRIIVFVGSPITESEDELVKLGKKLKKNNLSVDAINFGEEGENTAKLEAFINAVNNKDGTSHLVTVPPGPHILSDILLTSPIVMGAEGMAAAGGSGGGAGAFEFGVDPSLDPELALALRVSMEEERQRQEAESRRALEASGGAPASATAAPAPASEQQSSANASTAMVEDDEAALLAQAMAISVGSGGGAGAGGNAVPFEAMTEEEQIAMALQMSMGSSDVAPMDTSSDSVGASAGQQPSVLQPQQQHDMNQIMMDPSFLNSVLGSLPGVDPNDPRIQSVLGSLASGAKPDDAKKDDKEKGDEKK